MRLLLDGHIDELVATRLRADGHDVETIVRWRQSLLRRRPDDEILSEAAGAERLLVTYDVATMPKFAAARQAAGQSHAGVLLISHWTIQQGDVGTLIRSLRAFLAEHGHEDWTNRVDFLRRA